MNLLFAILLFFIALWVISFSYNIFYFFKNNDSEEDTIFINLSKTFEEAHLKLNILEKVVGRDLSKPRKKLKFYEDNARKTRRKYKYYADKIEPAYVKMFVGKKGSRFKKCWKHLAKPVKYHYINIYVFIGLVSLFFVLVAIAGMGWSSIIFIIVLLACLLRLYNFLIKINFILFFIFIDLILIIFKQDRGKLMKNVALLELMTIGWFGSSSNKALVYGAAGASIYSGYSGGSDFGGFGGGSFGGGGAGGSW